MSFDIHFLHDKPLIEKKYAGQKEKLKMNAENSMYEERNQEEGERSEIFGYLKIDIMAHSYISFKYLCRSV